MGRQKHIAVPLHAQSPARFEAGWPVNEVVLNAALQRGLPLDEIARSFGVSVEDVAHLCEAYGLELGQH